MLKEGRGLIILSIANPQDKHHLVPPGKREEQFKLEKTLKHWENPKEDNYGLK